MKSTLLMLLRGTALWLGLWAVLWIVGYVIVALFYFEAWKCLDLKGVPGFYVSYSVSDMELSAYRNARFWTPIFTGLASLVISQAALLATTFSKREA